VIWEDECVCVPDLPADFDGEVGEEVELREWHLDGSSGLLRGGDGIVGSGRSHCRHEVVRRMVVHRLRLLCCCHSANSPERWNTR
jgi:hypothetical protein